MKVFKEEQQFNQTVVIAIHSIVLITIGITTYYNWPTNPAATISEKLGALSGFIFVALLALLFFFMKLKTRVDEVGIHYRFYPFQFNLKTIPWKLISTCNIRKYNAISEYGGWGMKSSLFGKTGKSYTTKGNIGLQLVLENGRKVLIGTQKNDELQRTLNTYKHKLIA